MNRLLCAVTLAALLATAACFRYLEEKTPPGSVPQPEGTKVNQPRQQPQPEGTKVNQPRQQPQPEGTKVNLPPQQPQPEATATPPAPAEGSLGDAYQKLGKPPVVVNATRDFTGQEEQ